MLKLLSVKASVRCFRSLQCCISTIHQKYAPIRRDIFSETRTHMQVSSFGSRLYAKQVPDLYVEAQTDVIWTELSNKNQLPDTDVQNCREIIKLLLSFNYHKNHIVRELSENTDLLKFPVNRWKETVSKLQSYGFRGPHFLPLLAGCRMLLHGTVWNNLQEVLIFLRSLHIPFRKSHQVIAINPALLMSDDMKPIMQKYSNLLKVFTKNEAQTVIVKNPVLLTDPVTETNEIINYVYNEMGIRSQEISRSQVFMHSRAHVITRHRLAERAGVYKMPDRHEIEAKEKSLETIVGTANPSLSDLVDTTNHDFVHSFCSMTVAEYQAFAAMMKEELHEETEDDDADSDLSDSDSE